MANDNPEVYRVKSDILAGLGRAVEAERMSRLAKVKLYLAGKSVRFAARLRKKGDHLDSLHQAAHRVSEQDSGKAWQEYSFTRYEEYRMDTVGAIRQLGPLLVENPVEEADWVWNADLLFECGRLVEAESACTRVLDMNPKEAQTLRVRAEIRLFLNCEEEAVEDLKKSTELDSASESAQPGGCQIPPFVGRSTLCTNHVGGQLGGEQMICRPYHSMVAGDCRRSSGGTDWAISANSIRGRKRLSPTMTACERGGSGSKRPFGTNRIRRK